MKKNMIITGATSGIGLACARALLSRGARLGLAGRNLYRLLALAEEFPGQVEYERVDVTDPCACESLTRLAERMGGVDIYLHVAGIGFSSRTLNPETETAIFETNTVGAVRCVSAIYNLMASRGGGHIAVVTSVAGTKGIGYMAAYSASKGAVSEWLTAMEQRAFMEGSGVTFSDIRPGYIDTPLLSDDRQPLEMTLGYAVPLILGAVARRRRVAVIDWRWNLLVGLWRLIPDALWVRIPYKGDGLPQKPR